MKFDPHHVRMLLSKTGGERGLGQEGIHLNSLRYNSDALAKLRRSIYKARGENPKVKVKWSDQDLGSIWVLDPLQKRYFEVPALQTYAAGLSLYVHKIVLREKKVRREQKLNDLDYLSCLAAINNAVAAGDRDGTAKGTSRRKRWEFGQPSDVAPTVEPFYNDKETSFADQDELESPANPNPTPATDTEPEAAPTPTTAPATESLSMSGRPTEIPDL